MSSFKLVFKNLMVGGLIAASCLCLSTASQAADRVAYDRNLIAKLPSTNDDIGIAFLKTANNFPDFGKVVRDSNAYKELNPLAQQDYESKIVNKYQNSYVAFSQKKTDMIIRMKVNVLFTKLPNGEGVMKLRTFPTDPIYFPFYFAKYPIALIVKDMENFREIHLTKEETDIVYSRLSLSGNATMLLQLYALAANDSKPMMLDNIPQYPFLTEIGYIGFLNDRAEQVWAWKNEKYGKASVNLGAIRDVSPADNSRNTPPPQQQVK